MRNEPFIVPEWISLRQVAQCLEHISGQTITSRRVFGIAWIWEFP